MGLRAKNVSNVNANASTRKLVNGGSCIVAKSAAGGSNRLKKLAAKAPSVTVVAAAGPKPAVVAAAAPPPSETETTCITTTTYRSSSTSAIVAAAAASYMRPQTLNVHHLRETLADHTQLYFRELLSAWRAKARCSVVVHENRTQELFHELNFNPSDKQITEMLQTAKMLACKGNRQPDGLTFGEFCVLAADLKRFRNSTFSSTTFCDKMQLLRSSTQHENEVNVSGSGSVNASTASPTIAKEANCAGFNAGSALRSTKSLSNVDDCQQRNSAKKSVDATSPVEVFLGGSCNPTTWRADVAIPALEELGISFYNPQVSDWTPDLIELEHRAKEKARVLFFVMDSETRASAGAIEAAHIAGQNCKQLVLVLHPYKPNQKILNEHISRLEYIDLMRNQLILKELVTRRGLPVLDNIPSGLQRTKDILAGIRDPPSNIASILVVVRGAFDRVNPVNDVITVEQCQRALSYLGYAHSLIKLDNLEKIIMSQRESLVSLKQQCSSTKNRGAQGNSNSSTINSNGNCSSASLSCSSKTTNSAASSTLAASATTQAGDIDFDLFCIISAYLSVLQQEIHESGCISPIKGTNVPPPPIFLTNMQGDESFAISYFASKSISRNSSNASVLSSGGSIDERQSLNDLLSRSRDSGTSSPQPLEQPLRSKLANQKTQILVNVESIETTEITTTQTTTTAPSTPVPLGHSLDPNVAEENESDSNDSVFSSSSSINSVNCNTNDAVTFSLDFCDVYLGGSCALRSKWREEVAMPYLKSKNVSFHMPALHESIQLAELNLPQKAAENAPAHTVDAQERSFVRTRRKCRGSQVEEEEISTTVSEESFSWALPSIRSNLYNPGLLDSSRVLLFVITNETRSLAPMTLAAHCIGLMYNVVLAVQMLPDDCVIGKEKLTPAAVKDYNRGRSYLIDLAKRQGVPVFNDLKAALECTVDKVKACNSRSRRYKSGTADKQKC